jgi:hypothetical protein
MQRLEAHLGEPLGQETYLASDPHRHLIRE